MPGQRLGRKLGELKSFKTTDGVRGRNPTRDMILQTDRQTDTSSACLMGTHTLPDQYAHVYPQAIKRNQAAHNTEGTATGSLQIWEEVEEHTVETANGNQVTTDFILMIKNITQHLADQLRHAVTSF